MRRKKGTSTPGQADAPVTRVSIVRAGNYDVEEIREAVRRGIELIGGLERIVKPGNRVFVKINHLPPASPPEKGIVTHPIFVEGVLELLKEAGADITVGDDIESGPGDRFNISGFRQMCQRAGVRLVNLREGGFTIIEGKGRLLDQIYISRIALEADVIVNLPKLKTHSLTILTGGVKNMYGTIPASLRHRYHRDFLNVDDFSLMLTDIFAVVRPQLTIMDGIISMEGEGPAGGNLRQTNIILTSQDAVALDTVATSIIGLNTEDIGTIRHCNERGLGVGRLDAIEVTGESIRSVAVPDFQPPAASTRWLAVRMSKPLPSRIMRFIMRQTEVRPRVVASRCTGCAECVKICPTGAATIANKTATIDKAKCIQCMCCHEVCRDNAIALQRSFIGSVMSLLVTIARKILRR
jgi:uncharacterized protein (DUF362 family)/ferredoxin